MAHPIGFFEIQAYFAYRVAAITGLPLLEALLNYTAFYKRIGAKDWKYAATNPTWQKFEARILADEFPAQVAHEMYMATVKAGEDSCRRFGCMGYDCRESTRIVMHFTNNATTPYGPLSKQAMPERLAELKAMFTEIARLHPEAKIVEGDSWLYNYAGYRRLFPPEYTANMEVREDAAVRYNSAWGQFITSERTMDVARVAAFMAKAAIAESLPELMACFPFKILRPKAPISLFYAYYGISTT